ncbi:MAG: iron-sulfur cluster assembly accessory protein [Cytophagales bacterium]|tara:strand:- start:14 stop:340 length:327 start_codon:yes stop_codon:yes gene_type:complete
MINITDLAKEKIISEREKNGFSENYNVRINVSGGGCSGLKYHIKFDIMKNKNDEIFENKGIRIITNKESLLYLIGTTLDFSDGLNGRGFFFNNPNASKTCGCGDSFSI